MRAGDLDRLVTLQRYAPSKDAEGNAQDSWTFIGEDWAAFKPVTGKELLAGGTTAADFDATFKLRYRNDLNSRDQLINDGVTWDIVSPPVEIGRRDGIELRCKARRQ